MDFINKILLILLTIIPNITTITFTPLADTTIFAENLGKAQLYHEVWHLFFAIQTDNIDTRYQEIEKIYTATYNICLRCTEHFELKLLKARLERLNDQIILFNEIIGKVNRNKRGLFNFVGTVSKTLFGSLDENDLSYVNSELDKLYDNNAKLASAIKNQTKVIKSILESSYNPEILLRHSKENIEKFNRLTEGVNNNTKNIIFSNQITIVAMLIGELSQDVGLLINSINDGKHGIVHPQILTPSLLIEALIEFENKYNTKFSIPLNKNMFQHIIDMSEISIVIHSQTLIYSIKVPILESDDYYIQHLIPIPQKIGDHFIIPVPREQYILINSIKTFYVPISENEIEKCKKADKSFICSRNHPTYILSDVQTCETQIIKSKTKSIDIKTCEMSVLKIDKYVFIQLKDKQGYIFIPQSPMNLQILCNSQNSEKSISSPTLITTQENCILSLDDSIIKLKKSNIIVKYKKYFKNITIPYSENELNMLKDRIIPLQNQVDSNQITSLGKTLNEIENTINNINLERRTKSWKETVNETLSYLGYIFIICTTVFMLCKCGFFKIVKDNIPKICIHLFCTKNEIKNDISPQLVTYTPSTSEESKLDDKPIRFRKLSK